MEETGGIVVLLGITMIIIAQFIAFIAAFRNSILQALFCLIIPAYILMYMRREKTRMSRTLAMWYTGFVLIVFGVVLASI